MTDAEPARPRLAQFDEGPSNSRDTRAVSLRGLRRALAVNAVVMAREHANRAKEPFSQQDADVIMYITELLDKVAATQ